MKHAFCSPLKRLGMATTLAAILAFGSSLAIAQTDTKKESYEKLLGTVKALTVALQRDPGAGNPDVRAAITKVTTRQKEAEDLATVGEYGIAGSILDEGYRTLTQTMSSLKSGTGYSSVTGSAAATSGGSGDAARKTSYERQIGTAQALLDAAKRASAESQGARSADIGRIEGMLATARNAAAAGNYTQADTAAADALKDLRPLIGAMKGGSSETRTASGSAGAPDTAKQLAAFDARSATVKALLDAMRRQNTEKKAGKEGMISDIEARLARAEGLRSSDPVAAIALIEEIYALTRNTLQGMQSGSSLTPGSVAMEAGKTAQAPATSDEQRTDAQRYLASAKLIRDAAERIGHEKRIDNAAALTLVDTLAADARSHLASNPARAMKSGAEANRLAKEALEKARTGH